MSDPIVIIGSGLAGISVARELRKLDKDVPVVIVTADDGVYYSKPNLSNALAAGKTAAQLALTAAPQLASQLGAEIRAHTRVERLLPAEHVLVTDHGRISYRKLVLALGADPIRLPLQGDGAAEVLSVNNLPDYAGFRARLEGRKHVAILGAGLIGCEFANDLRVAGIAVDVFDLAPQPLGRLLPTQAAGFLRDRLEAAGVRFHFATSIAQVAREGAAYRLTDQHGDTHMTDLLLSAIGLKPSLALAQTGGLACGRGIITDQHLRTSAADIYALGDCAEVAGLLQPFVMPIMQAARVLAQTLASGDEVTLRYPAMPVVVKTPACPAVVCPPPATATGAWLEAVAADGVHAVFQDATGKPLGFALLGEAIKEKQALTGQMPAWL